MPFSFVGYSVSHFAWEKCSTQTSNRQQQSCATIFPLKVRRIGGPAQLLSSSMEPLKGLPGQMVQAAMIWQAALLTWGRFVACTATPRHCSKPVEGLCKADMANAAEASLGVPWHAVQAAKCSGAGLVRLGAFLSDTLLGKRGSGVLRRCCGKLKKKLKAVGAPNKWNQSEPVPSMSNQTNLKRTPMLKALYISPSTPPGNLLHDLANKRGNLENPNLGECCSASGRGNCVNAFKFN